VSDANVVRVHLRVRGIVQGVGFRPRVYSLATELGLTGFVLNDSEGVSIEVEGPVESVQEFGRRLRADPPTLAVIETVDEQAMPAAGAPSFEIRISDGAGESRAPVSPDVATCDECLQEIETPGARRFRYPFTNCTNCGPRFTITTGIPYDRRNTTMKAFEMCPACAAEYEDPSDRRFHAQPIACPDCGPHLELRARDETLVAEDALAAAVELLQGGGIIAVKGLGGYHLACDATDDRAVAELRRRKQREEKPLAVMVLDVAAARALVEMSPEEEAVLASRRRPIVLLARRPSAPVAAPVAPGNRYLGLMLPYTPLHHLVLKEVERPLVLTSGNLSDEPIAYRDADAAARLGPVADALLAHDRAIHVRCDDSVVRVANGLPYPLRRSRGHAPEPLVVAPGFALPVLGAGPELKHTFCLGIGRRAILSHHIGDLESWEAMSSFTEGLEHFSTVFDVRPEVVAHDLHPEYLSTKWALSLEGEERIAVQHHHAHIAACLADNSRAQRVIGLALDGTGFGADGAVWGCELLVCDLADYRRVGHLRYVPLPGGAAAVREPWRMAAVYLDAAFGGDAPELGVVRTREAQWSPILKMAHAGLNAPLASSAGRLFDAAAAICGIREEASYEGQAAAELEQLADPVTTRSYPCSYRDGELDGVELVAALARDVASGRPPSEAAAAFHSGLAAALVRACIVIRDAEGIGVVALSGGTWQNALLLERVRRGLEDDGFEVLTHHRVPPNDGGISLGQAVVANAQLVARARD
jgi:hydrogenase maturation protein HypF